MIISSGRISYIGVYLQWSIHWAACKQHRSVKCLVSEREPRLSEAGAGGDVIEGPGAVRGRRDKVVARCMQGHSIHSVAVLLHATQDSDLGMTKQMSRIEAGHGLPMEQQ